MKAESVFPRGNASRFTVQGAYSYSVADCDALEKRPLLKTDLVHVALSCANRIPWFMGVLDQCKGQTSLKRP